MVVLNPPHTLNTPTLCNKPVSDRVGSRPKWLWYKHPPPLYLEVYGKNKKAAFGIAEKDIQNNKKYIPFINCD